MLIFAGNFSEYRHRWELLDYAFILLAGVAVLFSARRLRSQSIRTGLWVSLLGFSASVLLHEVHIAALYASLFFSLLLIFFHLASYRAKHP